MFDKLTTDQLSTLHNMLYLIGQSIHGQMMDTDHQPLIKVCGGRWKKLRKQHDATSALMRKTLAEIQRRDGAAVMAAQEDTPVNVAPGLMIEAPAHLASCGHPANEDGECGCSSWPERAVMPGVRIEAGNLVNEGVIASVSAAADPSGWDFAAVITSGPQVDG
jgi:hypothetical protein